MADPVPGGAVKAPAVPQARDTRQLTGWGRTTRSPAVVTGPLGTEQLQGLIASRPAGGVLARGSGLSYGDAAQNAGGHVLSPVTEPGLELDVAGGTVTATAGTTFAEILSEAVPAGLVLPVLPGTRFLTLGGAIAADVHGKNHQRDGSISAWIERLTLVDGTGEIRELTPAIDHPALAATAGGLGLTGVVLAATLRLQRIETAGMHVTSLRAGSLAEVLSRLASTSARYGVAWIDATASGSSLGRGIVDLAEHATGDQLAAGPPATAAVLALSDYRPGRSWRAPAPPVSLITPLSARAFNTAWYRRAPREHTGLAGLTAFFHRLDMIDGWNRAAGPDGILQYQFVVPDQAEHLIEEVLDAVRRNGCAPFLGTIKRLGPGTGGELSFPRPGWCLAVDLPAGRARAGTLLAALDLRIADAGGRVYLAKDGRIGRDAFDAMYGPLTAWRSVRSRLDPYCLFRSDLGRRVGLC
jgi:decaprenylphospho-beta-D-ribofuranose 2-oxidase